jgi:hypothetical protein
MQGGGGEMVEWRRRLCLINPDKPHPGNTLLVQNPAFGVLYYLLFLEINITIKSNLVSCIVCGLLITAVLSVSVALSHKSMLLSLSVCYFFSQLVWVLYVDMVCLDYDGNLLDVCVMALTSALSNSELLQSL